MHLQPIDGIKTMVRDMKPKLLFFLMFWILLPAFGDESALPLHQELNPAGLSPTPAKKGVKGAASVIRDLGAEPDLLLAPNGHASKPQESLSSLLAGGLNLIIKGYDIHLSPTKKQLNHCSFRQPMAIPAVYTVREVVLKGHLESAHPLDR